MSLILKRAAAIFSAVLILYLIAVISLAILERNLLYYPQNIDDSTLRWVSGMDRVEEIIISPEDGVQLHGWLIQSTEAAQSPLVIYYGGNAEEVSNMAYWADHFQGYSLLLMNYRGYGLSQGLPSEKAIKKDAELIYDFIAAREDIDGENIVVMGRSLGSGVAIHIADQKTVKGAIVISPYYSIVNAAQRVFKIFPVTLIMRNRFESWKASPNITIPGLALVAEEDELIPPAHSFALMEKWGGKKDVVVIAGAGHDDIIYSNLLWESVEGFLSGLLDLDGF